MQSIAKAAAAALIGGVSIALSACASGLPAKVTRYSAMPAPAGQSFYVLQADGKPAGLEFSRYAAIVGQHLAARGYRQAASPGAADMLVRLGFTVDEGRVEYSHDPFVPSYYGPGYFGPYRRGYYGPYGYPGLPYYSRYGHYGPRAPFYYGWDNPYAFGPYGAGYTVYESELTLGINRRGDNAPLFEGRAKARSQTDEPGVLVPNLIEAMFTGFPGRSGETVRITVPATER